jgi:hypothetical protein
LLYQNISAPIKQLLYLPADLIGQTCSMSVLLRSLGCQRDKRQGIKNTLNHTNVNQSSIKEHDSQGFYSGISI